MLIAVQYLAGCPNLGVVRDRLSAACADADVAAPAVRLIEVTSLGEAERLGFRGSPTVLVDDEDPFAAMSAPVGFACRFYRTESGLEGAPSVAQLTAVLAR